MFRILFECVPLSNSWRLSHDHETARLALLAIALHCPAARSPNKACPGNPNALGIARTVEIDTTGGPGFGLEQYKAHDFLLPQEVVLTFDDGPWLGTTKQVLQALAAHCTKATFFTIGKHAIYYPEVLKEVVAAAIRSAHTPGATPTCATSA